jgi:hypothetical protein
MCVNIPDSDGNNPLSDWKVARGALSVVEDVRMELLWLDVLNLYLKQVERDVVEKPVVIRKNTKHFLALSALLQDKKACKSP